MEAIVDIAKTPESTGQLSWMNPTGDGRFFWNKNKEVEVEAARSNYDKLVAARYRAFRLNADGSQGELMDRFDPDASSIVMVPPLAGG